MLEVLFAVKFHLAQYFLNANLLWVLVSPDSLIATALSRFFWHWAAICTINNKVTFLAFRNYNLDKKTDQSGRLLSSSTFGVIQAAQHHQWQINTDLINSWEKNEWQVGGALSDSFFWFLLLPPFHKSNSPKLSNSWLVKQSSIITGSK